MPVNIGFAGLRPVHHRWVPGAGLRKNPAERYFLCLFQFSLPSFMPYGICHLSLVPARAEASDRAEMVTQLLFGDHFEVIEEQERWTKIITGYDRYSCWIGARQWTPISEGDFAEIQNSILPLSSDLVQLVNNPKGEPFPIVLGSQLPFLNEGKLRLGEQEYLFDDPPLEPAIHQGRSHLLEHAFVYLNSPYLWGGKSPFGIDCSGLTQMVYRLAGIPIPRDASQQALEGETLSFLEEALPGDLAFFDNEEGKIIHTGIILEGGRILHASGKVRIDHIDHEGIYNRELNQYTHRLRVIKKITA
jgi:hypothetical protein